VRGKRKGRTVKEVRATENASPHFTTQRLNVVKVPRRGSGGSGERGSYGPKTRKKERKKDIGGDTKIRK
jgi:hypothetical protein